MREGRLSVEVITARNFLFEAALDVGPEGGIEYVKAYDGAGSVPSRKPRR
jgi:hypothetical protein